MQLRTQGCLSSSEIGYDSGIVDGSGNYYPFNPGGNTWQPQIVTGQSIGGVSGSYPTTATTVASTQAADASTLSAYAAYIERPQDGGPSIQFGAATAVTGTLNVSAIATAAAASQATTDYNEVYAARSEIISGQTITVGGQTVTGTGSGGGGTGPTLAQFNAAVSQLLAAAGNCPVWQPGTTYSVGQYVRPAAAYNATTGAGKTGHYYQLASVTGGGGSGESGSSEPAWHADGTATADNVLSWTDCGPTVGNELDQMIIEET